MQNKNADTKKRWRRTEDGKRGWQSRVLKRGITAYSQWMSMKRVTGSDLEHNGMPSLNVDEWQVTGSDLEQKHNSMLSLNIEEYQIRRGDWDDRCIIIQLGRTKNGFGLRGNFTRTPNERGTIHTNRYARIKQGHGSFNNGKLQTIHASRYARIKRGR